MKKESDKQTIKKKKKGKKDKESNSSRDSLELTIKSLQESNKMNENKTGDGEKIKFFFNEFPSNKVKRFQTASHKRLQNINIHKEKEEFDFKEILLNYVNRTGRTTNEKRTEKNERGSVIYTKPNEVLTLKSDNNTNKNNEEFSGKISESSSEYISKSKSLSESSSDKQTKRMEDLHKKNKGNKSNNKEENNKKKKINNENKKKTILKNNIQNNNNNNEKIIKSNDKKSKKGKQVTILSNKKMLNSEKNIESIINSNHNKFTNSNKIKFSMKNTFTTATNTQNSSFKSLQLDFKKLNYDYLNLSELSLKKKLLIQNRLNSEKKNMKKEIKEKENENMFDKLKNLNICLDVEKSYSNYFKSIINSQTQKHNNIKEINNIKKDKRNSYDNKEYNKRYFFYPDEYYINKNSDLHSKIHVSNLFEQLRKNI